MSMLSLVAATGLGLAMVLAAGFALIGRASCRERV